MPRPLAPAEVPGWAWSELRQLPDLRAERMRLARMPIDLAKPRSIKTLVRRERLRELTLDILRRETRLQRAGIDPVRGVDLPPASLPRTETEH